MKYSVLPWLCLLVLHGVGLISIDTFILFRSYISPDPCICPVELEMSEHNGGKEEEVSPPPYAETQKMLSKTPIRDQSCLARLGNGLAVGTTGGLVASWGYTSWTMTRGTLCFVLLRGYLDTRVGWLMI
eukprot:gb/GECG01014700.1/.p1 GENE.gb/GECG01014700.1/~~gb/GECG01014700.1/.p1  ORF type:complete len:129 (+),score=1.48 gb/GECG01014700.1/:1-387(+)